MDFSKKLKIVREKFGISQEALAREIGVSFATINRLESGKCFPSYYTLNNFDNYCKKHSISFEKVNKNE